ncbi:MAG: hypothetical protein UV41_C0004G0020 [Candidatus Daviesbacteria bacterium GW2011_GWA2_42_7]|nr:MAG: hypothetical protein UV41_C0004G0020 [Candidatus Daviesbacteria bacterium GW2011_GWA2_42_7]
MGVLGGAGVLVGIGGRINKIEVTINNAVCTTEEGLRVESGLPGSNILFISEETVRRKLFDKFICIKDVSLKRQFPSVVKLTVDGRVAIAGLMTHKGIRMEATPSSQSALLDWSTPQLTSQPFLVDDQGVLFAQFQGEDLPKLFLPEQTVKVGQRLDEGLFKKISTVFTETRKYEINISEAEVLDQDFLVLSPRKIAFSLKRDILKQLVSLQLILQKAKIDESMIETVDLRFDKPVVKFLPKK